MTDPPQRGTLNPASNLNNRGKWTDAPVDFFAHFPAGDKSTEPGAAVRSQEKVGRKWTPFAPTKGNFKWRAGVCGDEVGKPQDHMRYERGKSGKPGKFYFGGQITRTFAEGSIMPVEINLVAHHNGFIELHVCDISKCGGFMSEACFKKGHCRHLRRAKNKSCDSGMDKKCGPIDPKFPHRWYLPCTNVPENVQERHGGPKMTWQLPSNFTCKHCVLHWFWSTANTCNPPGVIAYFQGKHGPKNWGNCPGQNGAMGGYSTRAGPCGPNTFPEEYYQCADIAILRSSGRS